MNLKLTYAPLHIWKSTWHHGKMLYAPLLPLAGGVIKLSPHYILEKSIFNFRLARLCGLDIAPEKWLNYFKTVETLIRCHILWHLIWGSTVCQLPFWGLQLMRGKLFANHCSFILIVHYIDQSIHVLYIPLGNFPCLYQCLVDLYHI